MFKRQRRFSRPVLVLAVMLGMTAGLAEAIDRKTGEILWIAGEPSGWSKPLQAKLLTMKGGAKWFWHQHGFDPDRLCR